MAENTVHCKSLIIEKDAASQVMEAQDYETISQARSSQNKRFLAAQT